MMSDRVDSKKELNGYWPLDRTDYSVRRRELYPSTRDAISEAVELIVDVARSSGCEADQETDLEIVLREALANAVIHGNGESKHKEIFVRCYGADSKTLILIRDQGSGFEPTEVPDPRDQDRVQLDHGRGLFLMRALMDRVEYRRDGREVLLFKRW
jgi:serine/threonine-protein kinase RsbW